MTDIITVSSGTVKWRGRRYPCALGRAGVTDSKREGDGATPLGCFPLRYVLYRADRLDAPTTRLPVEALAPDQGWCDDPDDRRYNQRISFPYPARHERLCRDDEVYDVIVVLGYNDDPVVRGCGSAIFLHVARTDYGPTEGCVALACADLLAVLDQCELQTQLCVTG